MKRLITTRVTAFAILTVAALIAYSNSFAGVFVFDDDREISRNPAIQ